MTNHQAGQTLAVRALGNKLSMELTHRVLPNNG